MKRTAPRSPDAATDAAWAAPAGVFARRMRRAWGRAPLFAACVAAAAPAVRADPAHYTIDPTHTFAHWEVMHFGTSTIRGRIGNIEGGVKLDRAGKSGEISITLDLSTLDTGVPPFNSKLRSAEFFDTAQHPKAWFVARRLEFDGDRVKRVTGELTLRGVSQGLTLTATRFNCYENPMLKREVCGGDFEGSIKRGDFDLAHFAPLVSENVRLVVQVEAIRQP